MQRAAHFMASHPDEFDIERVAAQLRSRPASLLAFLHSLMQMRPEYNTREFARLHDSQVQLYISENKRSELMGFLKTSTQYNKRAAHELCAQARPEMWAELALITHLLGGIEDALRILVVKARDLPAAIALAQAIDKKPTWAFLVQTTVATGSGDLLGHLLDNVAAIPQGSGG